MTSSKPTTAERRAVIETDMRAGRWVRGVSGRLYARAWDLPYAWVRADASAVSKMLRAERPDEDERVRRDVLDALDEAADMIRDALDGNDHVGEVNARVDAARQLTRIAVERARCLGRKR